MIKILFLAANPLDTQPLRLDEEMRAIDAVLRQGEFRNEFDVRSHWAVRISDIQELLLRHQPHIVHFSGHGSEVSEIILQNEEGLGISVSSAALSNLFRVLKDNMRCVVLNACYSKEQAKGIAEHIDSVIGMSDAITDHASIQFTTAFYRALGYGRTVATAFDLACNQLDLYDLDEAHKPQLLGNTDPTSIVFVSHIEPESEAKEMSSSSQINTGGGAYIGGSVSVKDGNFIGRDQTINYYHAPEADNHFDELLEIVKRTANADHRAAAVAQVNQIQREVAKGENTDDSHLAALIDGLIEFVPSSASAVISTFEMSKPSNSIGPVTKFVLTKLAKQG